MNRVLIIAMCLILTSCAELEQVARTIPQSVSALSDDEISSGLKAALNKGIVEQVSLLAVKDGFYANALAKIVWPQELNKVENTLRDIGLGTVADDGLKLLNRAAEDAVKEATPIFVDAVKTMSITDAKNILLGADNEATSYLIGKTEEALYQKFEPIIQSSLNKVGAEQVWTEIIGKYNSIPLVSKVNPDLTDYVTQNALDGVYKMIAVEEKKIRNDVNERTSDILRKVFALQD